MYESDELAISKEIQFFEQIIATNTNLTIPEELFILDFLYDRYYTEIYNIALVVGILTLLNRKGMGKLAFTYNEKITSAAKAMDLVLIDKFFRETLDYKLCFPELYDNKILTKDQEESMKDIFAKCQFQIFEVLEEISENPSVEVCDIMDCCEDQSKCLSKILEDENIPEIISTADISPGNGLIVKYQFRLEDIVARLAVGNYINPYTGMKFSDQTLTMLLRRLNREIVMAQRYFLK